MLYWNCILHIINALECPWQRKRDCVETKKWWPVQIQKDVLRESMLAILNRFARVILTIGDFHLGC